MPEVVERIFPSPLPPRRRYLSRGQRVRFYVLLSAAFLLTVATLVRGRGYAHAIRKALLPTPTVIARSAMPQVAVTFPADGATNVASDVEVSIEIKAARGDGIDATSLSGAQVLLVRTYDQSIVPGVVRLEGNATLKLMPESPLAKGTNYTIYLGRGLKDRSALAVTPHSSSFTTAAPPDEDVAFRKVVLNTAGGAGFTCVTVGPDHRLYASTDDGRLFRFPVRDDGTLDKPTIFDSLQKASGGPRLVIGFCFDPASTHADPILWVAHGFYGFENVPDWTGRISRISGPELDRVQDVVINLPRSIRDHVTMQPVFGPDGALYFAQGSNSAYGAPDANWGNRPERLLSASILRLDTHRVTPRMTIDVRTPDGGGTYDPSSPDAPLTIYAGGVRLAYDIVWTDDDELFASVNGSSAGGNAPGNESMTDLSVSEDDWLFRIVPGKYYGHPNPQQGYFILNGGNPTAAYDFAEVPQYPVGTRPDRKWMAAAYSFGKHASANGIIQYKNAIAHGGRLSGKLLVCRYNVPGDIAVLNFDGTAVTPITTAIPGLQGLANPLDLCEDLASGNLYVSEYGAQRITLLRPVEH